MTSFAKEYGQRCEEFTVVDRRTAVSEESSPRASSGPAQPERSAPSLEGLRGGDGERAEVRHRRSTADERDGAAHIALSGIQPGDSPSLQTELWWGRAAQGCYRKAGIAAKPWARGCKCAPARDRRSAASPCSARAGWPALAQPSRCFDLAHHADRVRLLFSTELRRFRLGIIRRPAGRLPPRIIHQKVSLWSRLCSAGPFHPCSPRSSEVCRRFHTLP